MEYQVLVASDEKELKVKVEQEIKNGWIPQGGVSIAIVTSSSFLTSGAGTMIAQAMTKKKSNI